MSRLATLSPAALKALFSPEAEDDLIALLTIEGGAETIRLANGYTTRLSETDEDILYGVMSRGDAYIFIPFGLTLPQEDPTSAPRCQITIQDVTRRLTPIIRTITTALDVTLELVLTATPDVVEVSFPGLLMAGVKYNANTISAELTVDSMATEPFPAGNFTPSYFPGLF